MTPSPQSKSEKTTFTEREYKKLVKYFDALSSNLWEQKYAKHIKSKTICPFCGGRNLTQDIKNVKGYVKGETHITWKSGYGYVDGKTWTDPVRVCQDCKNVWIPEKPEYQSAKDLFYKELRNFYFWIDGKDEQVSFDPENPKEKYKTREEKQAARDREHKEDYFDPPNILRDFTPETIKWYIKNNKNYDYDWYNEIVYWDDDKFENFGFKEPIGGWGIRKAGEKVEIGLFIAFILLFISFCIWALTI